MTSALLTKQIKDKIINWEYSPGEPITEKSICDEYDISRSPVRESLKRLEGEGYIEKIPHVGYRVIQLNPEQTKQLYDLRLALELYVVEELASLSCWNEMLAELYEYWSGSSLFEIGEEGGYAMLDRNFHESLAEALGNEMLLDNLKSINDRLQIFRDLEFSSVKPSQEEHLRILEAIRTGNVQEARDAVKQNVLTAREKVESLIQVVLAKSFFKE